MSLHKKKPRRASDGAFVFLSRSGREEKDSAFFLLTLNGFKARITFTNYIDPAFTADYAAIRMAFFRRT